jgi:hypothetical protein
MKLGIEKIAMVRVRDECRPLWCVVVYAGSRLIASAGMPTCGTIEPAPGATMSK